MHNKRDRLIEFELWATVERRKFLTRDLELNRQHRSQRSASSFRRVFVVTKNSPDLRPFENRGVKLHRLLGLIIKPQERSNFWHIFSPFLHLYNELTKTLGTNFSFQTELSRISRSWNQFVRFVK